MSVGNYSKNDGGYRSHIEGAPKSETFEKKKLIAMDCNLFRKENM